MLSSHYLLKYNSILDDVILTLSPKIQQYPIDDVILTLSPKIQQYPRHYLLKTLVITLYANCLNCI